MNDLPSKTRILTVRFNNSIHQNEIPLLRGAINHLLQENNHILFHNHDQEGFRYSYPLIQYKRINNSATMVCLNEGTEAVGLLLMQQELSCMLGDHKTTLEIDSVKANQHLIQAWDSSFKYTLRKWLPLNQDNYEEYRSMESMIDKTAFLEKILIGNILSMGKGLGIRFHSEVQVVITTMMESGLVRFKNVKMMSFDIEFKTNVSLPDYVGLGKGASIGYGMLATRRTNKIPNSTL